MQILACTFIFRIVESGGDALKLSQLGLVTTITTLGLALPTGILIDRMDKKSAIIISHLLLFGLALGISILNPFDFLILLLATGLVAAARNFRSISQFTVFGELLKTKTEKSYWVNLSTLSWQTAAFLAPLLAGYIGSGQIALFIAAGFICVSLFAQLYIVTQISGDTILTAEPNISPRSLIQFLKGNFKLHSSLTLDFFIVLFAGAASLLPFLHEGYSSSSDIGILKSALPAGVIFGTWMRLQKNPLEGWGEKLFIATAGYGLCHFFLADSSSFYFSYVLLFGAGIFDALSLTIRESILQLETPPAFKGRVYALNNFLVNASDELSEWESGLAAHIFGIRSAIRISGGVALVGAAVFIWKAKRQTALQPVPSK
jgi:hypothetical protein